MIVIPAIDLKGGRVVRLWQGKMDQESVYSEDPLQMARHWESKGAERLHVVDLDGAVTGRLVHRPVIREIVTSLRIPVEVGGGIRDLKVIEDYLTLGVRWVILGTVAYQNPDLIQEAAKRFPGRIILSMDAKGGKVAVRGWEEVVTLDAIELIKRFEKLDLSAIVFTDVERDGTGRGVNWELTRTVAQGTSLPVIASGGIARIEEVVQLKELEIDGVMGVIVGRALYVGLVDLEEAIRRVKDTEHRDAG